MDVNETDNMLTTMNSFFSEIIVHAETSINPGTLDAKEAWSSIKDKIEGQRLESNLIPIIQNLQCPC
jgi:hypothetical protein